MKDRPTPILFPVFIFRTCAGAPSDGSSSESSDESSGIDGSGGEGKLPYDLGCCTNTPATTMPTYVFASSITADSTGQAGHTPVQFLQDLFFLRIKFIDIGWAPLLFGGQVAVDQGRVIIRNASHDLARRPPPGHTAVETDATCSNCLSGFEASGVCCPAIC